jgi:hypothetical protein
MASFKTIDIDRDFIVRKNWTFSETFGIFWNRQKVFGKVKKN